MMENVLQPKPIRLLDIQKEVLQESLEEKMKLGEIKSDYEFKREWDYMIEKLTDKPSFMAERTQSGLTDADSFNETFRELEVDLLSLFKHLDRLEEATQQHKRLNQSVLNHFKRRIKTIEDTLTQHERLLDIYTTGKLHFETFIDAGNIETDRTYYTDHEGKQIPSEYRIKWDADQEAIKLPIVSSRNALIGPSGVRLGRISIGKQLGKDLVHIKNPLHGIDKAVDTGRETFWAEQILSDHPIEIQMDKEYYNIKRGALVEINIEFDYLTAINELGLTMFGEYPLDVVGVKYYESDNEEEEPSHLIHPDSMVPELKSKIVDDTIIIQFAEVRAKRMKVILNQRHYVKTDFLASEKEERELNIWFNSRTTKEISQYDEIFSPVLQEQRESNQAWGSFSNRIKRSTYNIDDIINEFNRDEKHPITKYEYTYGLYNLSLRKNEYQQTGIYVSKAIKTNGNIKTFQLETDETHPYINLESITDEGRSRLKVVEESTSPDVPPKEYLNPILKVVDDEGKEYEEPLIQIVYDEKNGYNVSIYLPHDQKTQRFTDVEYYVYDNKKAYPILPMDQKKVECERLFPELINGRYTATTRFSFKDKAIVRKNGIPITDEIAILPEEQKLEFIEYDSAAYYTVEYEPGEESYTVNFIEHYRKNNEIAPNRTTEEFKGTSANGTIELTHYPFADKEKLNKQPESYNPTWLENNYVPIRVRIIDHSGNHIQQPVNYKETDFGIYNVTDYFSSDQTLLLEPYKENEGMHYQYQVIGNQLHFNTAIPTDTRIIVEYPYLVSNVKLKAILRRNIPGFSGLTPLVNEYVGHFQTIV